MNDGESYLIKEQVAYERLDSNGTLFLYTKSKQASLRLKSNSFDQVETKKLVKPNFSSQSNNISKKSDNIHQKQVIETPLAIGSQDNSWRKVPTVNQKNKNTTLPRQQFFRK